MRANQFREFVGDEEFLIIHPEAEEITSDRMYSRQNFGCALSFLATKRKKKEWFSFNTLNINLNYSMGEHLSYDYFHAEQIRGDSVWVNTTSQSELFFKDSIKYEHSTLGNTYRSFGTGISYLFTYHLNGIQLMLGPAVDYQFSMVNSAFLHQTKSYETGLYKEGESQATYAELSPDGSGANGTVNTLNYISFDSKSKELSQINQLYLHLPLAFESRFAKEGMWRHLGLQIHGAFGYQWTFSSANTTSTSAKYRIGLGLNYYL